MDAETLIWTLILFGGTVVAMVWLSLIAWRKENNGADEGEGEG